MRIAAAACGLLLMVLAGFLRRDSSVFFADAGHCTSAAALVVPVWVVVAALVVVVLVLAAATEHGRALTRSALRPGRRLGLALSVALVGLSLVPWEYSWVRPSRSHLVIYIVLASLGVGLFVFGVWRALVGVGRAARAAFERLVGLGRWRFIFSARALSSSCRRSPRCWCSSASPTCRTRLPSSSRPASSRPVDSGSSRRPLPTSSTTVTRSLKAAGTRFTRSCTRSHSFPGCSPARRG